MKKIFGIVLMLGIGLFVVAGCGKSSTSEKKLSKSDDVFESGKTFKIRNSKEKNYLFEVVLDKDKTLRIYDLENKKEEYTVPYETEKQENGYLLYKFKGPKINDNPLFYNFVANKTANYYLLDIDGIYYFVSVDYLNEINGNLDNKETKEKIVNQGISGIEVLEEQ